MRHLPRLQTRSQLQLSASFVMPLIKRSKILSERPKTLVGVGITASRTVNPAQLGSVAITDNQSWVFSRHCTGGKVSLRMANRAYGRWQ